MNDDNLIKYLEYSKEHYLSLAKLMKTQNKERYMNEHLGKVKFIDLLLLKIKENQFENNYELNSLNYLEYLGIK